MTKIYVRFLGNRTQKKGCLFAYATLAQNIPKVTKFLSLIKLSQNESLRRILNLVKPQTTVQVAALLSFWRLGLSCFTGPGQKEPGMPWLLMWGHTVCFSSVIKTIRHAAV